MVKPLDTKTLDKYRAKTIVTIEENSVIGGFGSLVCAYFSGDNATTVKVMGVKDEFIKHASIKEQFKEAGLTIENLSKLIEKKGE